MAPESVRTREFTKKSDVWSWAILVTEIIDRKQPYQDLDNIEVVLLLRDMKQTPQMKTTLPEFWLNLLNSCWDFDPRKRPTFEEIVAILDQNGVLRRSHSNIK